MSAILSLGSCLREFRERRGVSLAELARATRVGTQYLESLEADELGALPSPVFTRGFIRAYCQVLQAPADEALLLYHRQTGTLPPATGTAGGERRLDLEAGSRGTVLVSFVLLVVLGLALVVVTLVLQSGREAGTDRRARLGAEPRPAPPPAASEAGAVLDPSRTQVAAVPVISPPAVAPEIAAHVGPVGSPYRLVARVSEPTWIRVRMGNGRATEETIPAGEVREWVSDTPFELTVGNAGGISLELNGRPLPPLGARGAVIPDLVIPPLPQ